MKINKSFIRIALAAGLIGLAACGGSDSSSRNRNSSTVTNVKRYEGVISLRQMSGSDDEVPTGDQYKVGFDIDLDSVSGYTFQTKGWKGDFRSSVSNLSIAGFDGNTGSTDLSKVEWAKCPIDARFYSWSGDKLEMLMIGFAEAPNDTVKNAECGTPSNLENFGYGIRGFYDSDGNYVSQTSGRRLTIRYDLEKGVVIPEDTATLGSILPNALDSGFSNSSVGVNNKANDGYSQTTSNLNLSSEKIKDYQPFELTANPQAGTINLNWKRSVDLDNTDLLTYDLLWSTNNFETTQSIPLVDVTEYSIPSCLVNPDNALDTDSKVSLQLVAIDKDGIRSPALEQSVSKSADTVLCPPAVTLAAPTGFEVVGSKEKITATWTAVEDSDPNNAISYCVYELNPNPADSTSENWRDQQESVMIVCSNEPTIRIFYIEYSTAKETKYFVQALSESGAVSDRSEIQTIPTPKTENVEGLKITAEDEGLNVKWNPGGYESFGGVDIFFAINSEKACSDDLFSDRDMDGIDNAGSKVGSVRNTERYFLSNERLGEAYVPGAVVTVCAKRFMWTLWGASSDWVSATYTNPLATTETPAPGATEAPAPVAEETAKAAIVTETATEVQLPAAAVEVAIKVEDVYTGFGVTASDVKSIEYQIDAGSWTAVTPGASLKIPKTASKFAVRVTKTNGEEVVSEKAIVRTEESTDTTAPVTTDAPADTTAPVTTDAPADTTVPVTTDTPASSDSSSSNNTLLYILGFIVVAGAAGFFIKKKSASTK
jgi:hypothetical protein